jgi:hypothetical protein
MNRLKDFLHHREQLIDCEADLQVQQTPNPEAQEPDEVPPLLVHSDLKK